jgi:hypothetical protein
LEAFANSNFITAAIGSLFGACGGALIAQRIANKSIAREELVKEIRNTNAAMSVVISIGNSVIGFKRQLVLPLKEDFDETLQEFMELNRAIETGRMPVGTPFTKLVDLKYFLPLILPLEALKTLVHEKLSVVGRSLFLTNSINESALSLNGFVERRNELVNFFKSHSSHLRPDFYYLYLGIQNPLGGTDSTYRNLVEGMVVYTDSVIFFCNVLVRDLKAHGLSLAQNYKKNYRGDVPKVSDASFDIALNAGLLPRDEDNANWFALIN